ncbi:MAG: peroxiredoxin [Thaumarchaeota archaeon]|nr:peroxiredoxin [Nitrososphaerota archaeon]
MQVKVGDRAPEFALRNQTGQLVSLKEFAGKQNVVLYFYPKDFTLGCTAETRSFSTNYDEFQKMGAVVLGVSSDSVESHRDFGSECSVSFPLLSDERGQIRRLYGVGATLGLLPSRVTFIIDKQGLIRHIFSSQLNPKKHIKDAIEALRQISN